MSFFFEKTILSHKTLVLKNVFIKIDKMTQMAKSKIITLEEIIFDVNARFIAGMYVENKISPRYCQLHVLAFVFSVILPAGKTLLCKINFCRCLNKIEICKQPTVKPWLNHDSPILKLFKYFFLCGRKLIFVFFFYLYLYSKELSFYLKKGLLLGFIFLIFLLE